MSKDDALIEAMADAIGDVWDCQEEDDDRLRVYARAALAVARKAILEEAASACENLLFGIDIDEFREMTKKEHSARACRECAAAIRALAAEPGK